MESHDGSASKQHQYQSSLLFINTIINGKCIRTMADAGATTSLIKRSRLLRVNYHHHTYGTMGEITLGDGRTTFWQYGSINLWIKINNIKTRVKAMVVDDLAADFILGMDWIKYYHVDILSRKRQLRIHYRRQQIIVKFDEDAPVDVKVAQEYKIFQERTVLL
ncbi:unnamed protein product, partial [Rotaria sp. Silwood2]